MCVCVYVCMYVCMYVCVCVCVCKNSEAIFIHMPIHLNIFYSYTV